MHREYHREGLFDNKSGIVGGRWYKFAFNIFSKAAFWGFAFVLIFLNKRLTDWEAEQMHSFLHSQCNSFVSVSPFGHSPVALCYVNASFALFSSTRIMQHTHFFPLQRLSVRLLGKMNRCRVELRRGRSNGKRASAEIPIVICLVATQIRIPNWKVHCIVIIGSSSRGECDERIKR